MTGMYIAWACNTGINKRGDPKMKKLLKIIPVLVLLMTAATQYASATAPDVGKFTSVEGKVDVVRAGRSEAVAVSVDEEVAAGDVVRTKSLSKAEIKFSDNTVLRMGESTRVEIRQYDIENGKRTGAVIFLDRGNVRAIVSKSGGKSDFKIETPNASGAVKGTDLFVTYQRAVTAVLVSDGRVSVINQKFPDKPAEITSGNTAIIQADEAPEQPRAYLDLEKERYAASTAPAAKKTLLAAKKEAGVPAGVEGYTAPGEMKATVTNISGSVRIRSRGSITWHDAKVNEALYAGDTIETKNNGKIEIKLDNNNIIDLKPDSQLVLKKLTENPETGEYENLFESKQGTIRAKVGKLKGNSKFEIKTPTAVGAVRGTIMYLKILPALTVAYFEEGNGYLQNLISNVFKVVPAGSCSSADDKGNITENCDSGGLKYDWNIDTGAEGYSPPGGGAAGNTSEGILNFYLLANNQFNSPFDKTPVTDENGLPGNGSGTGGSNPGSSIEEQTFTGKWGDGNPTHFYRSGRFIKEAGFEKGLIGSTAQKWWNGTPFEFIASGEYSDFANAEPYLWQTPLVSFNTITNNQKTQDGGAFFGRTVGIWNGGSMKNGKVVAIYLSPTAVQNVYDAGFLKGDVSGAYDQVPNPDSSQQMGVWVADGTLTASLMAQGITIQPSDFNDISGKIVTDTFSGLGYGTKGEGSMLGAISGETYKITGQNWGIWQMSALGSVTNNSSPDWRLALGGTSVHNSSVDSYFLVTVVGSNWSNGELEGTVRGVTLRPEGSKIAISSITGDAVGTYVDTTWHARGVGEWVELAQLNTAPGFDNAALAQLVSVPITETYSSLLTQTNSIVANGAISNMSMNLSLYAGNNQQIWAALFNGNYTGSPGAGWQVTLGPTGNTATLSQGTWNATNNTWTADVAGTVNNATITGQAGGTYANGALTGAGAGTWSQTPPK